MGLTDEIAAALDDRWRRKNGDSGDAIIRAANRDTARAVMAVVAPALAEAEQRGRREGIEAARERLQQVSRTADKLAAEGGD